MIDSGDELPDNVPPEVLAYIERQRRRERRFIAILSLPLGPRAALWLWCRYCRFLGFFRRNWNRLRHPERFAWRCVYCDRPTAQRPYEECGKRWPACCSRLRCLGKWESDGRQNHDNNATE